MLVNERQLGQFPKSIDVPWSRQICFQQQRHNVCPQSNTIFCLWSQQMRHFLSCSSSAIRASKSTIRSERFRARTWALVCLRWLRRFFLMERLSRFGWACIAMNKTTLFWTQQSKKVPGKEHTCPATVFTPPRNPDFSLAAQTVFYRVEKIWVLNVGLRQKNVCVWTCLCLDSVKHSNRDLVSARAANLSQQRQTN